MSRVLKQDAGTSGLGNSAGIDNLILGCFIPMDAPWYAAMIASAVALIYLCFFCNHLPKGIYRFCRENLLLLTG